LANYGREQKFEYLIADASGHVAQFVVSSGIVKEDDPEEDCGVTVPVFTERVPDPDDFREFGAICCTPSSNFFNSWGLKRVAGMGPPELRNSAPELTHSRVYPDGSLTSAF
jgi:hypothetical protein